MPFPRVTVCSFNPIKRTFVEREFNSRGDAEKQKLNSTRDLSDDLLDYLMMFNSDAMTLYGRADGQQLHSGDNVFKQYVATHPNFTADTFFMNAGFSCSDMFKMCSFGGRRFDCCKYATPVFSDLGKCFTLSVQDSEKPWMKMQTEPGIAAGLQIILDSHLEEQFDSETDGVTPVFSSAFENGFRYYVHANEQIPFLASEGIAVSPDSVVYSALSSSKYILLSSKAWGNCSDSWPPGYDFAFPYTAAMCSTMCKAKYFNRLCGCSPSIYNYESNFVDCTPYETYRCMDTKMKKVVNQTTLNIEMPTCEECRVECRSQVYHSFNSYGKGLSRGALIWLSKQGQWPILHMKSNFQVVNVFFRDMSYTEYIQKQGMSLTELLSDIGGNMGMFMGMSVFTIIELSLFLSKIGWIAFSRKRRDYMYSKKKSEEQHEKELEDVVTGFKLFRHRKSGNDMSRLREKIKGLPMHRVTSEQLNVSKLAWENEPDLERRLAKVTRQKSALKEHKDHQTEQVGRGRAASMFRSRRSRSETAPATSHIT
uniref:Amiloride-sensitive sodium channel n=2 Tax=Caenorhabditis japonica TaxID=281687 RepID=A0A8R1HYH0_CAEJA